MDVEHGCRRRHESDPAVADGGRGVALLRASCCCDADAACFDIRWV